MLGRRVFADGLGFGTVIEFQKKRLIGSSAHLLKLENHKIVEVKLQVRHSRTMSVCKYQSCMV